MTDELVLRDQIHAALHDALQDSEHGLKVMPRLIKRAIEEEIWVERKVHQMRNKIARFPTFIAYIEADPPEGLGATVDLCGRMIADDAEITALYRAATVGKQGAHRSNTTKKPDRGRAYTLDRLKREQPKLFEKVKAGKLSANAAAIEAGFRKRPSPLDQLQHWWRKASTQERTTFLAAIRTELS